MIPCGKVQWSKTFLPDSCLNFKIEIHTETKKKLCQIARPREKKTGMDLPNTALAFANEEIGRNVVEGNCQRLLLPNRPTGQQHQTAKWRSFSSSTEDTPPASNSVTKWLPLSASGAPFYQPQPPMSSSNCTNKKKHS